ncbi:MAG: type II secretion system F family protein [Collinsella sp.]
MLAKQEANPTLRVTIEALGDSVQGGSTFSEALAQHPRIFDRLFVNMVKAGELGGVLEVVLNRLAEYQEKAQKLKSKVISAMVYPLHRTVHCGRHRDLPDAGHRAEVQDHVRGTEPGTARHFRNLYSASATGSWPLPSSCRMPSFWRPLSPSCTPFSWP